MPLFRENVQMNTQASGPQYHLGFALLAVGQTRKAGNELNTALEFEPNSLEAGQAREALAQIAKGRAGTARCGEAPADHQAAAQVAKVDRGRTLPRPPQKARG